MNDRSSDVTGIILAGGKSSRFGSEKALFLLDGKPLIQHTVDILRPVCSNLFIVSHNPELQKITGVAVVKDVYPGDGPVAGIHAGLLNSGTADNFVLGCDMPFMSPDLFLWLLDQKKSSQVLIPCHNGFKETAACYYNRSCLETLEKALQTRKLKILDAIAGLNTQYIEVSGQDFYSPRMFTNINSLHDV